MIENHDIICASWLPWDAIPLVMHHMMTRFARSNRVLFVDPPVAYSNLALQPSMLSGHLRKTRLWLEGPRKVRDNLHVFYPPPLSIQYGHFRSADRVNHAITAGSIRRAAAFLGFREPILWIYHPYALSPHGQLGEKLVCYDCNDDVAFFFSRNFDKRARLEHMELELARSADLVLVTSKYLFGLREAQNQNTHYLPSAVDTSVFARALEPSCPMPGEVAALPKPVIGFVGGMVNSKMNWGWIVDAATSKPGWSFAFVGPCADAPPSDVTGRKNVVFLGSKPQDALPGFLKGFDVCMIPYQGEEFLRACQPTKAFEYLAAGKPVVSAWMPELEELHDIVYMARDSGEFTSAIERALEDGKSPGSVALYAKAGGGYTWEDRVERASALVVDALGRKGRSGRGHGH